MVSLSRMSWEDARLLKIKTLEAAASLPVTITQVKSQAVIEHTDDDTLLTEFIQDAVAHVEVSIWRSLVRQKKRLYLNRFHDIVYLPFGPVQSVDQMQYIDEDGNTQTVAAATYSFNDTDGYLRLAYDQSWPSPRLVANAVWVDYYAGYVDDSASPIATEIPRDLRRAILMLVTEFDRNREARNELQTYDNPAFDALVAPHRVYMQ